MIDEIFENEATRWDALELRCALDYSDTEDDDDDDE